MPGSSKIIKVVIATPYLEPSSTQRSPNQTGKKKFFLNVGVDRLLLMC